MSEEERQADVAAAIAEAEAIVCQANRGLVATVDKPSPIEAELPPALNAAARGQQPGWDLVLAILFLLLAVAILVVGLLSLPLT